MEARKRKAAERRAERKSAAKPSAAPAQDDPFAAVEGGDLLLEVQGTLASYTRERMRARELRRQLRLIDDPSAAAALLQLLDDDADPFNLRSHLLLALERLPEQAYFAAFLDAVPRLYEDAPKWGFTAMMRLLNTRGSEEDSAEAFEAAVAAADASTQELVIELLLEGAEELPDELAEVVHGAVERLRTGA